METFTFLFGSPVNKSNLQYVQRKKIPRHSESMTVHLQCLKMCLSCPPDCSNNCSTESSDARWVSSKGWLPPGIQKISYCFSLSCHCLSFITLIIILKYAIETFHGLSGLLQTPVLEEFAGNVCLLGSKIPDRNLPKYDKTQNAN